MGTPHPEDGCRDGPPDGRHELSTCCGTERLSNVVMRLGAMETLTAGGDTVEACGKRCISSGSAPHLLLLKVVADLRGVQLARTHPQVDVVEDDLELAVGQRGVPARQQRILLVDLITR